MITAIVNTITEIPRIGKIAAISICYRCNLYNVTAVISYKKMRSLLTPAVIAFVFILDRAAKYLALNYLVPKPLKIAPFFTLTYVENTGVAFGMFQNQNAVFLALSATLAGGLLFARKKLAAHGPAAELGLALVLGGALGNIYDRIAYGFVVDFFDLSFFPAVFNVGDSAITVGAALLAWGMRERVEDRGQRTEDRGQRTENRGQRSEG